MEVLIMFMEDNDRMRLQACRRGREIEKHRYPMDLKEYPPIQSAQTNLVMPSVTRARCQRVDCGWSYMFRLPTNISNTRRPLSLNRGASIGRKCKARKSANCVSKAREI
jgi:hypothetical protein